MTPSNYEENLSRLLRIPALREATPGEIGALLTLLSLSWQSLDSGVRAARIEAFSSVAWEPDRVRNRLKQLDERLSGLDESAREDAIDSAIDRFAAHSNRALMFALLRFGSAGVEDDLSKPMRAFLERMAARFGVPSATRLELLDRGASFLERTLAGVSP